MMADRYQKLRALADDPRTPEHERAVAAQRAREHALRHPGSARRPINQPQTHRAPWDAHMRGADEHNMRDICATCGKNWAVHWIAQTVPPEEKAGA